MIECGPAVSRMRYLRFLTALIEMILGIILTGLFAAGFCQFGFFILFRL